MSAAVWSALGSELSGKLISVEEYHGSDGHFVLSCLMAQDSFATCLVALHNTVGHYHNVSMKLGAPLNPRREKGLLQTIESLKQLNLSRDKIKLVKDLLADIREKLTTLAKSPGKLLLVIDDLSDLLNLGVSLQDVFSFVQYCRDMMDTFPDMTVVILSHIIEEDENSRLLGTFLGHVADIRAVVSGLPTGTSKDVSGSLNIYNKLLHRHSQHWGQQNKYHFRLLDREIQLFAPGTSQL